MVKMEVLVEDRPITTTRIIHREEAEPLDKEMMAQLAETPILMILEILVAVVALELLAQEAAGLAQGHMEGMGCRTV